MMTEIELLNIVRSMEADSLGYKDRFIDENKDAYKYYVGEPFGDEEENRSKVVSTDCADVVEADMPTLVRIFLGAGNVREFMPTSEMPDDLKEAEQKNKLIPYLIDKCPHSFKKQHDLLKCIEIYKAGIIEYGFEDIKCVEKKKYKGLNALEMTQYLEDFKARAKVDSVKIIEQNSYKKDGEEYFDIEVSIAYKYRKPFIENIAIEDLILSRGAQTKDDADIVGKRWVKTKGELVALGFDKETVKKLAPSRHARHEDLKQDRYRELGGYDDTSSFAVSNGPAELHWTMEEVAGITVYARIDYDEDGLRERRKITKVGSEILENEDFEHVPFAIGSAIMMPHSLIGRSRVEITQPTQRIQSVLSRGVCNNIAMVNAGRNIVSKHVNLDDMLAVRDNGIVRYRGEGPVSNHVYPLVTPYVGDKTLQVIQYFDSKRAQTTGSLQANQGLQADDLHKETATRFRGNDRAAKAKVELVCRVIAETVYKDLYEGMAWFAEHYQDDDMEIYVLGETYKVNPAKWRFEHYTESKHGTGAGDEEKELQDQSALLNIMEQLQQRGSMLVDEQKLYNQLSHIAKLLGKKDVSKVFNNPQIPTQLLQAQNEQLNALVQQLQQLLNMSVQQNPLADAERVKAQKEIALKQQQIENDNRQFILKLSEDARQFDAAQQLERDKLAESTAVDLTKIEATTNKNVPGSRI